MFIEPNINGDKRGSIEVVCGSMFSGKTEELIRRLKRAKIAKLTVAIFKPAFDKRYNETQVVSHDSNALASITIEDPKAILLFAANVDVVGIDEAQFFDATILNVCETLAARGIRVIVTGLDMDHLGNPFGPMPQLLAIADLITKLHAICVRCGNTASISYRKTTNAEQVVLGGKDMYEPRCRKCCNEKW